MNTMNYRRIIILYFISLLFSVQQSRSATSNLTLTSGNTDLNSGFVWARDLAMTYVATGRPGVPYPCYQGSYAHDLQYCIRDISHQVEAGHLLGLDTENFSMLKRFAESANKNGDDCRRHWPFWKFEFAGPGSNFTAELPTPFELSERAYEQYLWTGDRRWIDDPVFNEYFKYTNNDLTAYLDDNKNGIVDIAPILDGCNDGMASYWEFQNSPANESGDALGSQYQSYLGYAKILEAKGDIAGAADFTAKAEALRQKFEQDWYSESAGRYISGFLRNGMPLTAWGHEQSFFILLKRITDMGPRTLNYIDFVHSNTYHEGINIEATTYYPELFYHHNANHLGWHWLLYDLRSRDKYPEVPYLAVRNTICGLMGVRPDAPGGRVISLSRLVREVPWVEVDHIAVGKNDLKLRHDGQHKSTLTNNSGPAIKWEVQFYGNFETLISNGTPLAAGRKKVNGAEVSYIEVSVNPGSDVTVEIPQTTAPDFVYLSDLPGVTSAKAGDFRQDVCANGFVLTLRDNVEKEKNNTYVKGLGMKNSQQVTYQLDKKYYLLIADIGLDRAKNAGSEGQSGTTEFKVYADNEEIYSSGEMTKESDVKRMVINLTGKQELRLETVVKGSSYGDWVDARLMTKQGAYLDMNYVSIVNDNNRDGLADPGETLDLKLDISNPGFMTSGQNTILKCTAVGKAASMVTVNTPTVNIGSMEAGNRQDRLVNITVSPNAAKETRLEFEFELTDGISTKKLTQHILTPHPRLDIEFKRLKDNTLPAEADGLLNPGDEGSFEIEIKNSGTGISDGLKLECKAIGYNATYMTLPQPAQMLAAVGSDNSITASVKYALSDRIRTREKITVSFSLYDNNGEKLVKTIEKTFIIPSQEYKVKFTSLENRSNKLSILKPGQTSEITFEIENRGNKTGNPATLTLTKTENNVGEYHITTSRLDLEALKVGEKISKTIPVIVLKSAPEEAMISITAMISDGVTNGLLVKRFVLGAVYCSDMPWSIKEGASSTERDFKTMGSSPIRLGGRVYQKGIGTHSTSVMELPLKGAFSRFSSIVGIDDGVESSGSCAFQVYVDNNLVWESEVLRARGKTASCDVDVTGGQTLKLIVTDGGDGANSDHANWADARLTLNDNVDIETIEDVLSGLNINPSVCRQGDVVYADLIQNSDGQARFRLYDQTGRLRWSTDEQVNAGYNKIAIETSTLSSGLYILQVQANNGKIYIQKLIVL